MVIRTRFAPSPTGFMHIGNLRTAVYAYALAKHSNGQFILRIEDTDQKRQVVGTTDKIIETLKLFNLNYDEGPYVQSDRLGSGIYQKAAQQLLDNGHAFYCFCPPQTKEQIKASQASKHIQFRDPCRQLSTSQIEQKLSSGEKPAIRLKVPNNETISYEDFVLRKKNTWQTDFVDDAMLLKSDGFPTYHLAMPVDDHDMRITHVIRDVTWMPSTPIHLLVFKYLGFDLPSIGHPTAILDPAGGKLSKRKGNVFVDQFIADGYLPEAILNFVILLGWAPKNNQEMFTLTEFVSLFDINGFQKSNPRLNIQKLNWFNGQYIRRTSDQQLLQLIRPHLTYSAPDEVLFQIIPLIKERITTLKDFNYLTSFFFVEPTYPPELQPLKRFLPEALNILQHVSWTKDSIESHLLQLVEDKGYHRGEFFMALRLAVCGQKITPPLTESMLILGQTQVTNRLSNALK